MSLKTRGKVAASKLTKDQLVQKLSDLEEELHQANNSTDYWNYEYNQLLDRFKALDASEDPIQVFLQKCNIIDKDKVLTFIQNL